MKKKSFLIVILLYVGINSVLSNNVISGNKRIEKFLNEQGFFQNTISAIVSDKLGYLWIATPNGLVRYDGYSFEYFYHDSRNSASIPGNKIKNLLNDSEGKLWIGTDQGLCIYLVDKEQFISINYDVKNVAFIKEDAQKKIWVGKGSSIHVFNTKTLALETQNPDVRINLKEELGGGEILDIEFLEDSVLLLNTPSAIYKVTYSGTKAFTYAVQKLLFDYEGNGINKIIKRDNTVWIGTENGLYQALLEETRLTTIRRFFYSTIQEHVNSIDVLTLFSDKEKNLWIGTKHDGILKYDSKSENFISYEFDSKHIFGLTSNRINCFYEDEFGVIWIGTAQGGLNKLDKYQKSFQNYSHNPYDSQSLSSNLITNIVEDKAGHIWISFFDDVICRTTNEEDISGGHKLKFKRLEHQLDVLKNKIVVKLYQDFKGYWWIGTQEGLYFFDDKKERLSQVLVKTSGQIFSPIGNRVITHVSPNKIIIGGRQVFLLDDPWRWIISNEPIPVNSALFDIEKGNSVNDFKEDGLGNLWFGSQNGIFRIQKQDNEFVLKDHLNTNSANENLQLSHNQIFCIHKSRNRNIWVGSFGGGLMKIQLNPAGEPEKIKTYHEKDGLPDEVIYGILEDADGKLWMSTDMGICCFDPLVEKFEVFDVNDGILNYNFRQASCYKTEKGMMLMGGLNGLTVFNPEQITKNKISPKVLISRLKINDQLIIAGKKYHNKILLDNSISNTKKLILDHHNRNISLDIVVQHYSAPQKNTISYILEGVNKDWIEVDGGKATATYTNLNAGTYRFLYKGANCDGIWTEKSGELFVRILAPWYMRWWSLAIWGTIILLLIYVVFRYLINLEKLKQKLNFEQLDKERIHEMDQAKLRFFTNITHDFKTPLSLIIGPLEKIEEKHKRKDNQKYFSIIQNNISRLQRLIDQLISYRKAETGHLELKYSETTLGSFIYPLMEAFEENAKRSNINFYYKVNEPNRLITIDIDNTERILLNLFSNAVKFTEQNGEVSIEAGFREVNGKEILYFKVSDNGIGIQKEKIDKIFDRFYRGVDDRGSWSGTGIGLALCKSLIEYMKGSIRVESTPGKKTVFIIELPFNEIETKDIKVSDINKYSKIVTDWMPDALTETKQLPVNSKMPTLLIIDDEKDVRSFLKESLGNIYNIVLAVDGEDGFNKLMEYQPQLVICDVMMPHMSGYELCEKVKSDPETCHIPVILLTALENDDKMIEGLELGADDYITKPFSIKHLETRIKMLIENKQRLIEYFSKNSVIPDDNLGIAKKDRSFLESIISSIESNLSNSSFGVEELAKCAGMSNSHLYRRLKQLTGQVPNVYIRNLRLQKAAEILKQNKDITAVEVMYEIGIESPSYFSTSFKKMYGTSPREYQKKN
ncbi:hybrid sensor histidine kinase/response regulator transcription factor [Saccharicrinis sp. GN24d3]|uniref:hybrid sensor histidine kinase/response regulator transcription factor n=1 Tax=Saccharicrinis sp. GN24d3 TaxID=3458416 RepID=UPI00403733BC